MNIYTNNTFEGFYPVGSAAVVSAENAAAAAALLNHELETIGLKGDVKAGDMILFPSPGTGDEEVRILCDGNY